MKRIVVLLILVATGLTEATSIELRRLLNLVSPDTQSIIKKVSTITARDTNKVLESDTINIWILSGEISQVFSLSLERKSLYKFCSSEKTPKEINLGKITHHDLELGILKLCSDPFPFELNKNGNRIEGLPTILIEYRKNGRYYWAIRDVYTHGLRKYKEARQVVDQVVNFPHTQ
jgi:hypothetical protein